MSALILVQDIECRNCHWKGKRNALLKHLSMKLICATFYDIDALKAEQEEDRKVKKRIADKNRYNKLKQLKKKYYEDNKDQRLKYQREYDSRSRKQKQKYYNANLEERQEYQRDYNNANKEQMQKYYIANLEERQEYQRDYDNMNKEQKQKYYIANLEERQEYQNKYYEANMEKRQNYQEKYYRFYRYERKEYQRKYDRKHIGRRKEYRKLKAHYKNHATKMYRGFQNHHIRHFRLHRVGRCSWSIRNNCHGYCWEKVPKISGGCEVGMFKLRCNDSRERPCEINALQCMKCTQVMCNLCGKCIKDYEFYEHYYIPGLNSDLKEAAKLCPYRTYLNLDRIEKKHFPCKLCTDSEIRKFGTAMSSRNKDGKEIYECPYDQDDVASTLCITDAITKLAKRIRKSALKDGTDALRKHYKFRESNFHRKSFDLLCEFVKHMELHADKRHEYHIVEITLKKSYSEGQTEDLLQIDRELKKSIEALDEVLKIKSIITADKCLGFTGYSSTRTHHEAWLAIVPLEFIDKLEQWDSYSFKYDTEVNSIMKTVKDDKDKLYMIIYTHEGSVPNNVDFFESLSMHAPCIKESKLLFTWTIQDILMEEDKQLQKSLVEGDFIQSKIHPNYVMNLTYSELCDCGNCNVKTCAISESHAKPVDKCPLPMNNQPIEVKQCNDGIEYWAEMFLFAWNTKFGMMDFT